MLFAVAYTQDLDPLKNQAVSTIVAALPVLTLFYLLVARAGWPATAGATGAVVAILIAWLVYAMPLKMASWAFVHGAVVRPAADRLDRVRGDAAVQRHGRNGAVRHHSPLDRRGSAATLACKAVLIGFCFGAFMEGAAGAGSPVAICGAMLVGLGVPPFRAAVICLIANTSPVCYGGPRRTPIITLGSPRTSPPTSISIMCGHQLPILVVPDPAVHGEVPCAPGGRHSLSGRRCWSAAARSPCSSTPSPPCTPGCRAFAVWPLTDIGGGIFSLITLALFLRLRLEAAEGMEIPLRASRAGQTAERGPKDSRVAEGGGTGRIDSARWPGRSRNGPTAHALAESPSRGRRSCSWRLCLAASGVIREQEWKGHEDWAFEIWGITTPVRRYSGKWKCPRCTSRLDAVAAVTGVGSAEASRRRAAGRELRKDGGGRVQVHLAVDRAGLAGVRGGDSFRTLVLRASPATGGECAPAGRSCRCRFRSRRSPACSA